MSERDGVAMVRGRALLAAEVGLLVLALGVVTSFNRVFVGWSWWVPLAVPVAAAWALTISVRRLRIAPLPATALQLVSAVLVIGWVFLAEHMRWGLPTPTVLKEAVEHVRTDFALFADLIAPVPASTGFLLGIAAAMWVMVVFADIAAVRFRAPAQAALPYAALFVAVGLLPHGTGMSTASTVMAVSLALFAATQRGLAASEFRWVAGRVAAGTTAVVATTLVVGLVAVAGGALGGRLLPGGDEPVLDLRGYARRDDRRTIISPFVTIRSMLGERSNEVMFRVEATAPSYWRLTALERYDPTQDIWVSRGNYRPVDGTLASVLDPALPTSSLMQVFRVEGLSAGWLPAAYAPAEIDAQGEVRYNSSSASLLRSEDSDDDQPFEYELRSEVPAFAGALDDLGSESPDDLDPELTRAIDLAPSVSEAVDEAFAMAAELSGVDTPDQIETLLIIQDWFRLGFSYDDTVDYSDADDPLAAFIEDRRGFCQQFSSAFALLARSLGLPSRVAVGFTPGDAREIEGADGDDGTVEYVVRGRHAHAWPEVYLNGAGWVPFEPTPQRGDPQGEDHTGVAAAQAPPPASEATTTTVEVSDEPSSTSTTEVTQAPLPEQVGADPEGTDPDSAPGSTTDPTGAQTRIVFVALAVAAAVVVTVVLRRRLSRHRSADGPRERVARAWTSTLSSLARSGRRPSAGDTPVDFARRVDAELGEILLPLATIETRRRFGPGIPTEEDAARADVHAAKVEQVLRESGVRRRRRGGAGGPWPSSRHR